MVARRSQALRLIRPPEPLSVLVRGFDGALPEFWDVAPDGLHRGAGSEAAARTPESGVSLDLEFVIRIVLGLLAISLAAGALASERQAGMLYALISQPVRRSWILTAKLLGGFGALSAALAVVMTGTAAALGVFGPELWSSVFQWTVVLLAAVGLLYLWSLYALGVVIAAFSRSVSAANVVAMSVWVATVVAAIPASELAARVFSPVPTAAVTESHRQLQWEAAVRQRQITLGRWFLDVVGPEWREVALAETFPPSMRLYVHDTWVSGTNETRGAVRTIDASVQRATLRQRHLWTAFAWSLPAGLVFDTMSRLTATGVPTAARWDDTALAYQTYFERALFDDPPGVTLLVPNGSALEFAQIPFRPGIDRRTLTPPGRPTVGVGATAADTWRPFVLLAVYVVGFVGLSFVVFPRMRY